MPDPDLPLTPRTKHTLDEAARIARACGHGYIGTEHLMLALLEDPDGIGGGSAHQLGVAQSLRDEILRIIESDDYSGKR
jgi:ATP-dependent Clp protease ATP-binding subunit ClpA